MILDLNKFENILDEALSNETSETLNNWLNDKRMMQCYSDGLGNGIAVGRGECSFESVADEKEYLIKTYGGNK